MSSRTFMRAKCLWHFLAALVVTCYAHVNAGTFFCDFDNGLPPNAKVFGNAFVDTKDGVNHSGVLKLTEARISQLGSFIIDPLDGTNRTASFVATFKAHVGDGSSADGFAFHFAPNLPNAAFADLTSKGLSVVFDTYKNSSTELAPSIRVRSNKGPRLEASVPNLRNDHFVEVMIKLDPDGTLDLLYDNELIYTNVHTTTANLVGGRFAFGARTGSRTDNHFIDDLKIVTQTSPRAFVERFSPTGNDAPTVPFVYILLRKSKTAVKVDSVKLKIDKTEVSPDIAATPDGNTEVQYDGLQALEPGTTHHVTVRFADTGHPSVTTEFSFPFKVTTQVYLSK